MDRLWSNPCEFPRVADDEEADGDIRTFGPGALSGYGVGGDTRMLGSGRLSGDNHNHEDINGEGLGRTGPISMSGNTKHEDHRGKPFGPPPTAATPATSASWYPDAHNSGAWMTDAG